MPRDSGGTYLLPSGNPVVSGTIIQSTWANDTMGDLGNEMTDSLSRTGNGGMLAPLRHINGSEGGPAITFINDITSGRYLVIAGEMRDTIASSDVVVYTSASVDFQVPILQNGVAFGTAATLDVQASPTDTAAGLIALNNAFGMGDGAPPEVVDATSRTVAGKEWWADGTTNRPPNSTIWLVDITTGVSGGARVTKQVATSYVTNETYENIYNGSTWTGWERVWTGVNYQPDTVDGLFVAKFMQNVSGGSHVDNGVYAGSTLKHAFGLGSGSWQGSGTPAGSWKFVTGLTLANNNFALYARINI